MTRVSESADTGRWETMEGAAGKGGSAEEAATLNDAPLTTCVGGGPLQTILHPGPEPVSPPRRDVTVDRDALRTALLELHDVRARQGADWRWMDSLHPSLRVELDAAMQDAVPSLDEKAIRHHERQLCAAELLILAERNVGQGYDPGSALTLAATAISRRQVA